MRRGLVRTPSTGYLWALWEGEGRLVQSLPPPRAPRGGPRRHSLRTILNAVFSVVRAGGAWRLLPRDLPPWKTVSQYFRKWRLDGTWERIHMTLRERVRVRLGRDPPPRPGVPCRQAVNPTNVGSGRR